MATYFDRYQQFRSNGNVSTLPRINIETLNTDKQYVYKLGKTRLDRLSQEYYTTPYYGWLILLANPQFGGLEFDIPDESIIRIPFPFNSALERYNNEVKKYKTLYG